MPDPNVDPQVLAGIWCCPCLDHLNVSLQLLKAHVEAAADLFGAQCGLRALWRQPGHLVEAFPDWSHWRARIGCLQRCFQRTHHRRCPRVWRLPWLWCAGTFGCGWCFPQQHTLARHRSGCCWSRLAGRERCGNGVLPCAPHQSPPASPNYLLHMQTENCGGARASGGGSERGGGGSVCGTGARSRRYNAIRLLAMRGTRPLGGHFSFAYFTSAALAGMFNARSTLQYCPTLGACLSGKGKAMLQQWSALL